MTRHPATPAELDQPIPYTLTAKAHAALASPVTGCRSGRDYCPACADRTWSCLHCTDAFFGTPPEDGLCAACRDREGGR